MPREHICKDNEWSAEPSWWVNDGRGIPLARVCDRCTSEKLKQYRPEIMRWYDESDVGEQIEPEE